MPKNIFYKSPRNKLEIISFHLPFISFRQTWTINGKSNTKKRFACNCVVNGERRIAHFPEPIVREVKKYAERKALKKNAVVEASLFFNAPIKDHPMRYSYVVSCYDSYPPITVFDWKLSKEINSIKEIVVETGKY